MKNLNKKIKIFEAFAGIGAQHKALINLSKKYGKDFFEIVGLSEWYIPAIIAYHSIHHKVPILNEDENEMRKYLKSKKLSMDSKSLIKINYWNKIKDEKLKTIYSYIKFSEKKGNIFDIREFSNINIRNIDLLTYSFPCQDLSIQGKGKGIKKGTKSGLLFEIEKYINNLKKEELPEFLLMENVKTISGKKHIKDFKKWLNFLKSKGYYSDWKILNSQNFGSPQKRERIFVLSSLKKQEKLPLKNNNIKKYLKNILDSKFNEKYRLSNLEKYKLSDWQENRGFNNIRRCKLLNYSSFSSETYVYDKNHVGCTLTAQGANSRIKILYDKKIRMLNPKETYKYMGFTSFDFKRVKKTNFLSNSQIVFTAGNSISIEVLEEIFDKLIIKNVI